MGIEMRSLLIVLIGMCLMLMPYPVFAEEWLNTSDVVTFLASDETDGQSYTSYHSCGAFARDLSANASRHNISIGGAILGVHPLFRGTDNHAMNYFYNEEGNLTFIEPQNDYIVTLDEIKRGGYYRYIRLYPDGTQMPSYWTVNLAPTIRL